MSILQLPKKDAVVLAKLAELPLSDLKELFESLGKIEPGIYFLDRLDQVVSKFSSDKSFVAADLRKVIYALSQTRLQESAMSEADFVHGIVNAVSAASANLTPDFQALQAVVVNLLALENVNLSIKATALALDGERPISDVNIISDIRAVFSDSDDGVIDAMFVSTLFKVSYYESGASEPKFLLFSLDDEDIEKLERVALSAKKKRDALCAAIEKSGAKLLRFSK